MAINASSPPGEPNKYSLLGSGDISVAANGAVQNISSLVIPAIGSGYIKVTIEYNKSVSAATCQVYAGTDAGSQALQCSQAAANFIHGEIIISKNTATPANIDGSIMSYGATSFNGSAYTNGAGSFNLSATEEIFINVKTFVADGNLTGKWRIEYFKA